MVDKVVLANVSSFQNDTSAVSTVNNNMALITTAMDNTLSRDGTSPNTMSAVLDMNSQQIINLPAPSTTSSPARLIDVVNNPTIVIPGTGTSGHVVPFLDGNNTFSGTNTFTSTVTLPSQSITTSEIANNAVTTAQIGINAVSSAQLRQGVARSIIGVTGNATANEADIQGTTRQVLAVSTAGTGLTFAQPQGDQLLGTTTNDSATAGNVGEFVSNYVAIGSAITMGNAAANNVNTISLTAGDWDVSAIAVRNLAASTSITNLQTCITTISGSTGSTGLNSDIFSCPAQVPANDVARSIGPIRFSLNTTTTIFLVCDDQFTVSTNKVYGSLSARRVR